MSLVTRNYSKTFWNGDKIEGWWSYESTQTPSVRTNGNSPHQYASYVLTAWSLVNSPAIVGQEAGFLPYMTFSNVISGHIAQFEIGTCLSFCADEVIALRFLTHDLRIELAWWANYQDFLTRPPGNLAEWGTARESSYRQWPVPTAPIGTHVEYHVRLWRSGGQLS